MPEQGPEHSRSQVPATLFPRAPSSAAAVAAALDPSSALGRRLVLSPAPLSSAPFGVGQNQAVMLPVTLHPGQLPTGVAGPSAGLYGASSALSTGPTYHVSTTDLKAIRREIKARRSQLRAELTTVTSALRSRRARPDRGRSAPSAGSAGVSAAAPPPAFSYTPGIAARSQQSAAVLPQSNPPHSVPSKTVSHSGSDGPPSVIPVAQKSTHRPSYSAWPAYESDSDSSSIESHEAVVSDRDTYSNLSTSSDECSTYSQSSSNEFSSQYSSSGSASDGSTGSEYDAGIQDGLSGSAKDGHTSSNESMLALDAAVAPLDGVGGSDQEDSNPDYDDSDSCAYPGGEHDFDYDYDHDDEYEHDQDYDYGYNSSDLSD